MISKIIVLCGPGGAGKTSTLKRFAADLVSTGACQIVSYSSSRNPNDVIQILEYHGRRVCISSYGDEPTGIKEGYDEAVNAECDVFITASRIKDGCKSLQRIKTFSSQIGVPPIYIGAIREKDSKLQKRSGLHRLRVLRVVLEFA